MALSDYVRLGALLTRLARPATGRPDPRVVEQTGLRSAGGLLYDRYEPRGRARLTLVAVHGVTPKGKDHPDLCHFARSLAATGLVCVAPTLPGLVAMRFDPRDPDALAALVSEVAQEAGEQVVLIGFCYGASYALLAGARPEAAAQVRSVLAIGAYYSLETVREAYEAACSAPPADEKELEDRIYLEMMLAYRHRERLGFSSEAGQWMEDLLRRYCCEASLEEKRQFRERHLAGSDLLALDRQETDPATLAALSPAGNLTGLRCPVGLIHDPADRLVPAAEAERLARELRALPGGERHRVLVTPLMSHVTLSGALDLHQGLALLRMLVPLVRG